MNNPDTFIIAEVGQNHNGDMNLAHQLVDIAAMPIFDKFNQHELKRVDAIKFTKRDLSEELSVEAQNQPYDSPHSFGKTYGEHRRHLELSYEQHVEIERYVHKKGIKFVETLTSLKTLKLLEMAEIDVLKVASRDLTNLPLLEELAKARKRIILSTGMGAEKEIDDALGIITKYHQDIVILHCVSEYPASYENMNLFSIPYLKEKYPFEIGLSDHSIGIVMAPVAVALGAAYIEKHITLNRQLKGSDHAGSLEPDGLWRMVRDIRNVEIALGEKTKFIPQVVQKARVKLERSIAAKTDLAENHLITEKDLCLLSPGTGLKWTEKHKIIGKKVLKLIPQNCLIDLKDIEHDLG